MKVAEILKREPKTYSDEYNRYMQQAQQRPFYEYRVELNMPYQYINTTITTGTTGFAQFVYAGF